MFTHRRKLFLKNKFFCKAGVISIFLIFILSTFTIPTGSINSEMKDNQFDAENIEKINLIDEFENQIPRKIPKENSKSLLEFDIDKYNEGLIDDSIYETEIPNNDENKILYHFLIKKKIL